MLLSTYPPPPPIVVGLQFRAESKAAHQLLFKQHSVRTHSDTKPPDRTLFIVNVPPYCTEVRNSPRPDHKVASSWPASPLLIHARLLMYL